MRSRPPRWALAVAPFLLLPLLRPSVAAAGKPAPTRDRTPPSISLVFPAEGEPLDRPAAVVSGTVSDPSGVARVDLEINGETILHPPLDQDGLLQALVSLRPGSNILVLTAVDTAGNSATLTRQATMAPRQGMVVIESPIPGARIASPRVTVSGRVDAEAGAVYLDGIPARVEGGRFSLDAFPLEEGANLILATNGNDSDCVPVTRVAGDGLVLSVSPPTGEANLVTTFGVSGDLVASLGGWEIDAYGTGEFVAAPSGVNGLQRQYAGGGIYSPTVRARNDDGTTFSARTMVSLRAPAQFLASFPVDDPSAIAVDPQGRLAVLERGPCRLRIFNTAGDEIARVGKRGTKFLEFADPSGLAVDAEGNFLVADTGNHRIQKLSPALGYLSSWGKPGGRQGELNLPSGIAVDSQGSSHVVDAGNRRVQVFGPRGVYQRQWPLTGMTEPRGIAVTADDGVIVSDRAGNTLRRYDDMGEAEAWEDASLKPYAPAGLWHDDRDRLLLVAESAGAVSVIAEGGTVVRRIDRLQGDATGLRAPVMAVRSPLKSGLVYHVADAGTGRVVTVGIEASTGTPPPQVWQNVRGALGSGNIEAALAWFCPCARERYRSMFEGIRDVLPQAAAEMRMLVPLEVGETTATYGSTRTIDGKEVLFPVEFVLDKQGQWRIESW
jgi:DNA-binding beta-propeller fold protein YncE